MKSKLYSLLWCSIVEHSLPIHIQDVDLRPYCLIPGLSDSDEECQVCSELRKALGNREFEDNDTDVEGGGYGASCVLGLEDARDRLVDMIVDVERGERERERCFDAIPPSD